MRFEPDQDIVWLIAWAEENATFSDDEIEDPTETEQVNAAGQLTFYQECQKIETLIKRLYREAGYR